MLWTSALLIAWFAATIGSVSAWLAAGHRMARTMGPAFAAKSITSSEGLASRPSRSGQTDPLLAKVSSGYQYFDKYGKEYDVPFIREPKWYRLIVRKGSEFKLCENLMEWASTPRNLFHGIILDACSPQAELLYYPSSKAGSTLAVHCRPALPSLAYVKAIMNPKVAEAIEAISTVRSLFRNELGFVAPLASDVVAELEGFFDRNTSTILEPHILELRRGSYVEILDGEFQGSYGYIAGSHAGRIVVQVVVNRREFPNEFDVSSLRPIAEPHERPLSELSPQELVDEMLETEPDNPLIKFLHRSGQIDVRLFGQHEPSIRPAP